MHHSSTLRRSSVLTAHLSALLSTLALVAGCGGGAGTPSVREAQAPQALREAACGHAHLHVTVQQVQVRLHGGGADTWHAIALPAPRRIDLLAARGGVLAALGAAPLPPGRHAEIRLQLSPEAGAHEVQPIGGPPQPLVVLGGDALRLAVRGGIEVPAGRVADVVPVDACAGVVPAGHGSRHQLRPVLEAGAVLLPAGQEHRLDGEQVVAWPAGGYALARAAGTGGVLQAYGPDGRAAGPAVTLARGGTVTALAGGHLAVQWLLPPVEGPGAPVQPLRLMAQVLDAAGAPVSAPRQAGEAITWFVSHVFPPTLPHAAALAGGGFGQLWSDFSGPHLALWAADGTPLGAARPLALTSPARLVALRDGGFLVVAGLATIVAARFGADGAGPGPAHTVGDTHWSGAAQVWPQFAAAALASGRAVVAWSTAVASAAGPAPLLRVQLLQPDGAPSGAASTVGEVDRVPAVAGLDDGGFVVAWVRAGGVQAQRFSGTGAPLGAVARLDTVTTSPQDVAVTATGAGGFLVSWTALGADGQRALVGRLFDARGLLP